MRFPTHMHPVRRCDRTPRRLHPCLAIVLAIALIGPVGVATAQTSVPKEDLEASVSTENEQLQRLKEQLEALQSLDKPEAPPEVAAVEPPPPEKKPPSAEARELPSAPLPGAEEAFADAMFALGEYERARAVYQQIIDGISPEEIAPWVHIQLGNCARREGDFTAALSAYDVVMTSAPESYWAEEAAWWTGQIKWQLLWKQLLNPDQVDPTVPAAG